MHPYYQHVMLGTDAQEILHGILCMHSRGYYIMLSCRESNTITTPYQHSVSEGMQKDGVGSISGWIHAEYQQHEHIHRVTEYTPVHHYIGYHAEGCTSSITTSHKEESTRMHAYTDALMGRGMKEWMHGVLCSLSYNT